MSRRRVVGGSSTASLETAASAAPTEPPPPYYVDEEPPCFCKRSTPWDQRRYDGTWEEVGHEQRTCLVCGASLSRRVAS